MNDVPIPDITLDCEGLCEACRQKVESARCRSISPFDLCEDCYLQIEAEWEWLVEHAAEVDEETLEECDLKRCVGCGKGMDAYAPSSWCPRCERAWKDKLTSWNGVPSTNGKLCARSVSCQSSTGGVQ